MNKLNTLHERVVKERISGQLKKVADRVVSFYDGSPDSTVPDKQIKQDIEDVARKQGVSLSRQDTQEILKYLHKELKRLGIQIERVVKQSADSEETAKERLSYKMNKRMNGLVNKQDISKIKDGIRSIRKDLKDEGFEDFEIDEYLKGILQFSR